MTKTKRNASPISCSIRFHTTLSHDQTNFVQDHSARPTESSSIKFDRKQIFGENEIEFLLLESLQSTFRSSNQFRYASTDEQQENEQKKKNITNLMYVAGALTGLGAIYSLVCGLRMGHNDEQKVIIDSFV